MNERVKASDPSRKVDHLTKIIWIEQEVSDNLSIHMLNLLP